MLGRQTNMQTNLPVNIFNPIKYWSNDRDLVKGKLLSHEYKLKINSHSLIIRFECLIYYINPLN